MKHRALILVDLQNDFMPDYDFVVATQDWHPSNHGSFAANHPGLSPGERIELGGLPQVLWPVHCVQETPGASFHSALDVGGIHAVVRKGEDPGIDSYSGFFDNGGRRSTGLTALLRGHGITAVDVMGLATDYCVRFTALDGAKQGFEVRLLRSGCRGVELAPGDIDAALAEMAGAGVEIVE